MYVTFVVIYKLRSYMYVPPYLPTFSICKVPYTNAANGIRLFRFSFLFFRRYLVGFWIGNSEGLYVHRTIQKKKLISMHRVDFENTIGMMEWLKTAQH